MNCPGCGFANEVAAQACHRCRKVLGAPPAPALADIVRLGGAPGRVPSWPNLAILCLLLTPALALFLLPYHLQHSDEMGPPEGSPYFLWMAVSAAGALLATLPLAARLQRAPLVATIVIALSWLLDMAANPLPGSPQIWTSLGGLTLAWGGRDGFTRDWDLAKLSGRAMDGYKRLLAPDRWAIPRLLFGFALLVGGVFFVIWAGNDLRAAMTVSRPVAKFLAIPSFIGGCLAMSGTSWYEPSESK